MVTFIVESDAVKRAGEAFVEGAAKTAQEIATAMDQLGVLVSARLKENTPVATGILAASTVHVTVTANGVTTVTISQPATSRGQVYRPMVVRGTVPHMVNSRNLHEWVRIRYGLAKPADVRRAAFAVAKQISMRGTPPNPFPQLTIEQARGDIRLTSAKILGAITVILTDPLQSAN